MEYAAWLVLWGLCVTFVLWLAMFPRGPKE